MVNTLLVIGAIVGGIAIYSFFSRPPAPVAAIVPAVAPTPSVEPEPTIITVPTPYPVPTPTPPTEPAAPPEEEPFIPPEGPDFYTSYTIGESWMLNYFHGTDPGSVPDDWTCRMEFVRYDTLRSPYSWSYTFDYICDVEGGGTGTYRRTVNVVMGVPSIGY